MSFSTFLALTGLGMLVYAAVFGLRALRDMPPRSARRRAVPLAHPITDPKEAASILMVHVAAMRDSKVPPVEANTLVSLMAHGFGVTEEEAKALFEFGRQADEQVTDLTAWLRKLLTPIREHLTLEEMKDLVSMLEVLAATPGKPTAEQARFIQRVRRSLHLEQVLPPTD